MNLNFNISLADGYTSPSQIARVLTEDWLVNNMYCPICGEYMIKRAETNAPVKDCVCENCKSQYELKSKKISSSIFQSTVNDGVYRTMIERITSLHNPSFFFMHYDHNRVNNLVIVPKCFFTPSVIEERAPLPATAKRAGWIGCNILMNKIPSSAKIPVVLDGCPLPMEDVVNHYNRVFNLQTKTLEGRGWLNDVLQVLDRLENCFSLKQIYDYVEEFQRKHPNNNHIQDKIRQQLQYLRDKGFIEFRGNGNYRKIL